MTEDNIILSNGLGNVALTAFAYMHSGGLEGRLIPFGDFSIKLETVAIFKICDKINAILIGSIYMQYIFTRYP